MKRTSADRAKRYHVLRMFYLYMLGGECVDCGSKDDLEFHHRDGVRTWVAAKKSRWVRIAKYEREIKDGKIEILCAD